MKTAQEIYPNYYEDGRGYGPGDYAPILEEIGDILIQVDDEDYQGDSRVLFKKDGRYGYLIFGWGSCSGCDRLQGCDNYKELQECIDDMVNDVHWFDSLEELQQYFKTKDWALDYSWHAQETREFVDKVLQYKA